jgi:2',3'-cyclic-nucleotide 2'-phosphodiesterase (5'-nucleotidase family)
MNKLFIFLSLSFFFLYSCQKVFHIADVQSRNYEVESNAESSANEEIANLISPYKIQIDELMNEVIGESAITMIKAKPQSTLGNWVADLIYKKSQEIYKDSIDFSVVNYSSILTTRLSKGSVKRGKIFELMPFENMLVVLKVKGDIVQLLFDRMADNGGWPISAQIRSEIRAGRPQNITINGEPIDTDRIYKIALSDYLANGGDQCFFFREQPRDELDIKFRDAILSFIEEQTTTGKMLDAEIDFRVKLVEE